jgi:hypothetical protein
VAAVVLLSLACTGTGDRNDAEGGLSGAILIVLDIKPDLPEDVDSELLRRLKSLDYVR